MDTNTLTYKVREYVLWLQRYEKITTIAKIDLFLIHIYLIYRYKTHCSHLYFSLIYLHKRPHFEFKIKFNYEIKYRLHFNYIYSLLM